MRAILLASVMSFGLALPAAAQTSAAEGIIRAWLKDLQVDGAKVETGALLYDKASDTLTIRDLVYARPVPGKDGKFARLKLAETAVTGLGNSAASITAKSLAIKTLTTSVDDFDGDTTVSSLEAQDLELPKLANFKVDPANPLQSHIAYLREISRTRARSVTVGSIRTQAVQGETKTQTEQAGITVAGLEDGRLQSLKLGALTSRTDTPAGPVTVTVKPITLSQLDLSAYTRIINDGAYASSTGDGQWRPLIGSLSFEGLQAAQPGATLSIGAVDIGAFKLRQFARPIGTLLNDVMLHPDEVNKDAAKSAEVGMAILSSVALDGLTIKDVAIEEGNQRSFRLTSASLKNASVAGLDQAAVAGLQFRDAFAALDLGRANLVQLVLPNLKAVVDAGTAVRAGQQVAVLGVIPTFAQLQIENFGFQKAGGSRMTLAAFDTDNSFFIGPIPTKIKATLKNLVIPGSLVQDDNLRRMMEFIGSDQLDLSGDINAHWNDGQNEIAFESLSLGTAKLGSLNFSGSLTGIPKAAFETPATLPQFITGAGVRKARLLYHDDGLATRMLEVVAAQNKQTPDAMRKLLAANMPGMFNAVADGNIRNRLVYAGIAFVNEPRTLEFTSSSNDPIPLAAILTTLQTAPANLPALLKLDIFANKK